MTIKNIFSKTWLFAQYQILKYSFSMRKKTDDELSQIVIRERNLRAWCSQRSYYLAALRKECKRRNIEYIQ